jgi:hypothetical protein
MISEQPTKRPWEEWFLSDNKQAGTNYRLYPPHSLRILRFHVVEAPNKSWKNKVRMKYTGLSVSPCLMSSGVTIKLFTPDGGFL